MDFRNYLILFLLRTSHLTCDPHTSQILEGLVTIIIAIVSATILPSDLSSAKFLTPEERIFAGEHAGLVFCVKFKNHTVRRFESNDVTYLKGAATEAQSDSLTEKESDVRVESPSKSLAVGAEEEQFEWWEVIRGLMH
jgi:hypothetical protein